MSNITYVIEHNIEHTDDINSGYTLYSIVPTNFAGDAKNYITQGTLEHCEAVKQRLENEL